MSAHTGHDDHKGHPTIKTYVYVALALFGLTFLTIIAHQLQLGAWKAPIAFFIAAVKAALVMLWFMHMKEDNMMNRVIFGSGFFFLILLFFFSVIDIGTRTIENSTL
jgi:cytochrome c oxidase subunit IV